MKNVKVGYIADELVARYGIEMDKWDVMRLSASCMKRMGAYALQRKVYCALVTNFTVTLPPDAYEARGAIRLTSPRVVSTPLIISDVIEQPPQVFFVETVEDTLTQQTILLKSNYVPWLIGDYIDYDDDFPILKFNETDIEVAIEYTGLSIDKEGFPMIPECCWEACMFFCLFTHLQSGAISGKVQVGILDRAEKWKDESIARGRASLTMRSLTSNERDKLMNIMVSLDRKSYNIPS